MINAWDKTTFGSFLTFEDIGADGGGSDDHLIGFQQDADGAGTADELMGYHFDSGGGGATTAAITTSTGVWLVLGITLSGTSAVLYWRVGTTGPLSTASYTTGFNATTITRATIASDLFDEHANGSFWSARLWVGATLSGSEMLAEAMSGDGAPVRTSNLDSHLALADGTNPETATTGTNWTRTGTFVTGATNPHPGLELAQGSYALTGQAVGLQHGYTLSCVHGSYALSGQDVTLTYSAGSGHAPLVAAQGSYALTGQAVTLRRGYVMLLEQALGDYETDSVGIGLYKGSKLQAVQGSYALTGNAVGFVRALKLPFDAGAYSLAGQAVTLRLGRAPLAAAQGSYALTGQDVALTFDAAARLAADQGLYSLTGQNLGLRAARQLAHAQGSYVLAGQDATLRRGSSLVLAQGLYALTGQSMAPRAARALALDGGLYTFTGQPLGLAHHYRVPLAQGLYALAGQDVALTPGARTLAAAGGVYVLTGHPLSFNVSGDLDPLPSDMHARVWPLTTTLQTEVLPL